LRQGREDGVQLKRVHVKEIEEEEAKGKQICIKKIVKVETDY